MSCADDISAEASIGTNGVRSNPQAVRPVAVAGVLRALARHLENGCVVGFSGGQWDGAAIFEIIITMKDGGTGIVSLDLSA